MEISNPVAVDRALGKHIGNCPWQSRLTTLQEFNTRAIKEKIYYGDNDTAEKVLQNLAKSIPEDLRLPIVGYFRALDIIMDTTDGQVAKVKLSNIEGTRHYDVEYSNYIFRYSVMIIGFGSASIHEVGLPLHQQFVPRQESGLKGKLPLKH